VKTTAKVAGYGNLQVVSLYDIQTWHELELVKEAKDSDLYKYGEWKSDKISKILKMETIKK